jgi:uncharacterized protein YndB with AHSA1/START domain
MLIFLFPVLTFSQWHREVQRRHSGFYCPDNALTFFQATLSIFAMPVRLVSNNTSVNTIKETDMAEATGTVTLHRVLRAPTDRVYKAFIDKQALEYWLPPYGFTGTVHEIDASVGGGYRMSFTNFSTGESHSFTVKYLELEPGKRLCHTDRFDSEELPGEMRVTITLNEAPCGTELRITQEDIPAVIPEAMCYLGWQESLAQLARLVEPDIPEG